MKKSYLYAACAILMWSTMSTISKLLLNDIDSFKVLCLSTFFATITMIIINICSKKWALIKSYSIKDYLKMSLIGLPGVFLYYAFYYAGTEKLPASQAFIINYLWPIMSIVFASIILKEKLTTRKIIAIVLSFIGVFTVAGKDIVQFKADSILSIFLCFCAAVCYGLYTAINKKSSYDKQVSMTVAMLTAFIPSLIITLFRGENLIISSVQLPAMIWSGVATMALANLAWVLALSYGNTAKISNLAYITPFLSLLWTFIVLDEPIELFSILGLCLIVIGIFIQLKDNSSEKSK